MSKNWQLPKVVPKRAKGRRYPVEISAVAWTDLLGYGDMLRRVNFDPSHDDAQNAVARLRLFQITAAKVAMRHLHAMIINDGVAYVRELSPRAHSVTYDFLKRTYDGFVAINEKDKEAGFCGARMIIAVGPRLRVDGAIQPRPRHLDSILSRLKKKRISNTEAIKEAFRSSPVTGSVIQLQANFAFTKAYLADQAGTSAGFAGAACFTDANMFDEELPSWLHVEEEIDWAVRGLTGKFFRVGSIDFEAANACNQEGIRNALSIAAALSIDY